MQVNRFLASQLRKPSGWFGSLVFSRVLNRVNRKVIESTLARLEVSPHHHVLEIGFGGGSALSRVAGSLTSGVVTGVDFSPDMVRGAERKFRRQISQGRMRVQVADVANLPFAEAEFDRLFTINTIYFWPDTLQGFREIRRVLKEGGLAAIALRSREKMQKRSVTKYGFRLFSPEEVSELMREAGFAEIRVDHRDQDKLYDEVIVVGVKGE